MQRWEVFGVPTFIANDKAVFVRLMSRPEGDGKLAETTVERVIDIVDGFPDLNEYKFTRSRVLGRPCLGGRAWLPVNWPDSNPALRSGDRAQGELWPYPRATRAGVMVGPRARVTVTPPGHDESYDRGPHDGERPNEHDPRPRRQTFQ